MKTFKLRFTDSNNETGNVFSIYETDNHGWKNKDDFLNSLSKYEGRDNYKFFDTGYQYLREEIEVITKVEII
jgi:hypothetical protein